MSLKMEPEAMGQSSEVLVREEKDNSNRLTQYLATTLATLGALSAGTSYGWTSPATKYLTNGTYIDGYHFTDNEVAWIGSLVPLGAVFICLPLGYMMDWFGRKTSMLMMGVPFILGWGLVLWATGVEMMYAGRFLIGVASGTFTMAAPVYSAETVVKEIRGRLGSACEVMQVTGVLFVYILGAVLDITTVTIICFAVPIIFVVSFFFMPETPTYYIMKNRERDAEGALKFLRGAHFDIVNEMEEIKERVKRSKENKRPFFKTFNTRQAKKGLVIALGLNLLQQLSGVNAVTWYAEPIFDAAHSTLSSDLAAIILGVVQLVAVLFQSVFVDKIGRRFFLLISTFTMGICSCALGVYFYLSEHDNDVEAIGWLPVTTLAIYYIASEVGLGPIPWMMVGEMFVPHIQAAASIICVFGNWVVCFFITKFYSDLTVAIGIGVSFMAFAGILFIGCAFVYFVVIETKGKTIEQIQDELSR